MFIVMSVPSVENYTVGLIVPSVENYTVGLNAYVAVSCWNEFPIREKRPSVG